MDTNFLVIGSGISGLNFALNAAKKGKVLIITKKKIVDSNTNFAQGGIAAVLDKTDDYQKHISDTLEAGHYHNNKKAVEFMVKNSPEAIYRLVDLGVEFEKEKGKLKLTQEGGHGKRRIAYVGDYTGKEIESVLVKRVREHPNIEIYEDSFALELIVEKKQCFGCQTIRKGKIENIFADQTILATGGIGQLFTSTTNAKIATGDGIAMGIRAGLKTEDLEFIQFHPTAFDKKIFPRFLISETLRGEGATIVNEKGEAIMKKIHPQKDLAPRDIVAREIYKQSEKHKIYLDIRSKSKKYLQNRFPQIYKKLEKHGYKLEKDLIPITPAAHYECGGIKTNLKGQTRISRLFAFGEVAHTGVHGANRLASNSLLEALVFSNQILSQLKPIKKDRKIKITKARISKKSAEAKKIKEEIQSIMWQYAGIVRNRKEIKKEAIKKLKALENKVDQLKGVNQEIAEARNMLELSKVIFKAILKRKKSLGCHFIS
jgi:L-aspartate oxidase